MLHIATVHYGSPRWIDIQIRQLQRHISGPFTVWTSLEGIDPAYASRFDHVLQQRGSHAGKLNHLALEIAREADGDDLLMFLDGDAFPISDPVPLVQRALSTAPLTAVCRAENGGDKQPHPCFCATTVEAWDRLRGDWSDGATWTPGGTEIAPITDVGGNLLRRLEATGTPWTPILRSNRSDLHPLFFGIYGDVVYHHGAGFRSAYSRADTALAPTRPIRVPTRLMSRLVNAARWRLWWRRHHRRIVSLSQSLYAQIQSDDPGWLDDLVGAH